MNTEHSTVGCFSERPVSIIEDMDKRQKMYNKYHVYTKRMPNGQWSCYTTASGYDHAFTGGTLEEAMSQMIKFLNDRGILGQCYFAEVVDLLKVKAQEVKDYQKHSAHAGLFDEAEKQDRIKNENDHSSMKQQFRSLSNELMKIAETKLEKSDTDYLSHLLIKIYRSI